MKGPPTIRVVVHGRVQGVGYRAWMHQRARRLGLAGWVRNRRDGTVEAIVQGEAGDIARLVDECRAGPPSARVEDVETTTLDDHPPLPAFDVRPTA